MNFGKVARVNDSLLHQKSRSRWIKERDANTKYFHSVLNWRERKNAISKLNVEGSWCEEPSGVKQKVKDFLEKKFERDHWEAPKLNGILFNQLS